MSPPLRAVTAVNALVYLGASAYHTGWLVPAGALGPASIAEAPPGLVLVAAILGLIRSPLIAYGIVLAGTLFGLAIVVAHGLLGVDLWIHIVMLAGLVTGFALIFGERGGIAS